MPISIVQGDITLRRDEAIVNAANEYLTAGSGVCGAIHDAAGPELEQACKSLGACQTGKAVLTPGFSLPATYVIHAVGPRWWNGERGEPQLLKSCYESIFALVIQYSIKSIAIPAISTGIYGYPLKGATHIAVDMAKAFLEKNNHVTVTFVCFDPKTYQAYLEVCADAEQRTSGLYGLKGLLQVFR